MYRGGWVFFFFEKFFFLQIKNKNSILILCGLVLLIIIRKKKIFNSRYLKKYVKNGIGMDYYYALLDKVINNPKVEKVFYPYTLEYVKLNPGFDECKNSLVQWVS